MNSSVELARPASRPAPLTLGTAQARWTRIQALRHSAERHLAVMAVQTGTASRLLQACHEVWSGWEREALISILHRDYDNAELALDRGVHSLRHALDMVQKARLSEDVILSLLAAA
jgi:hypothetical protein